MPIELALHIQASFQGVLMRATEVWGRRGGVGEPPGVRSTPANPDRRPTMAPAGTDSGEQRQEARREGRHSREGAANARLES